MSAFQIAKILTCLPAIRKTPENFTEISLMKSNRIHAYGGGSPSADCFSVCQSSRQCLPSQPHLDTTPRSVKAQEWAPKLWYISICCSPAGASFPLHRCHRPRPLQGYFPAHVYTQQAQPSPDRCRRKTVGGLFLTGQGDRVTYLNFLWWRSNCGLLL